MARPRQVSDEQILATMRACLIEQGAAVSLDVVAEQLGVTGPALLKRFGHRQELVIRALMPPDVLPWAAHLDEGPDARPLSAQLTDIFLAISAFVVEGLPAMAVLRQSGIPAEEIACRHPNPRQGQQALANWLKRAHQQGLIAATEHDTAATAMIGAVQGNAMMAHFFKRAWSTRSQREYVKELVALFTRALGQKQSRKVISIAVSRGSQ